MLYGSCCQTFFVHALISVKFLSIHLQYLTYKKLNICTNIIYASENMHKNRNEKKNDKKVK